MPRRSADRSPPRPKPLTNPLPLTQLWRALPQPHKQRLVEEVVVHVKQEEEHTEVTIHWQGGFTSRHEIRRVVRAYESLRDYTGLLDRVKSLWDKKTTLKEIAAVLDQEGFVTPRRRGPFTEEVVRHLL